MADTSEDKSRSMAAPTSEHRFGDEEIGRILQRAADLQERSPVVARQRGLTLAELRQVAREAGIDERFVEMAAAEAASPVRADGGRFLGAPAHFRHEVRMEGEISDRDREEIIVALRRMTKGQGHLADVYGRMEWSHNDGMGPLVVGVTSRDGTTEIDIDHGRSGEPGLYFGLGVPLGGLLGAAAWKALGGQASALIPLIGMSAVGSWALIRAVWKVRSRYWRERTAKISGTLSEIVRQRALPPASESDPGPTGDVGGDLLEG